MCWENSVTGGCGSRAWTNFCTHFPNTGEQCASLSNVQDAISDAYKQASSRPRFCHLSSATCPPSILLPFPFIFSENVGPHGRILDSLSQVSASKGSLDIHSIAMAVRLRSSNAILPYLLKRRENLRKFGIQHGAAGGELLRSWGFGKEEVEDLGETFSNIVKVLDPYPDESD